MAMLNRPEDPRKLRLTQPQQPGIVPAQRPVIPAQAPQPVPVVPRAPLQAPVQAPLPQDQLAAIRARQQAMAQQAALQPRPQPVAPMNQQALAERARQLQMLGARRPNWSPYGIR